MPFFERDGEMLCILCTYKDTLQKLKKILLRFYRMALVSQAYDLLNIILFIIDGNQLPYKKKLAESKLIPSIVIIQKYH